MIPFSAPWRLQRRLHRRAPVSLRLIDAEIGFGVFADRDLVEGELIGE